MSESKHLPLGVPTGGQGKGACLLTNNHSVTLYSTTLHLPLWVAFTLTSEVCVWVLIMMGVKHRWVGQGHILVM